MVDRSRHLKDVLWLIATFGAVAIAFRLWYGLGATTNLTDMVPWGLWKILNMVAGVALATGGFTVGLLVYVLRMESLRPLVKPAILVAFLGYGSSVFALVLDIGLPHRIWHPLVMWNIHSFLFEVAMCVMFYFTVTIVELTPTILERFPRWAWIGHALHRIAPAVVIFGITLSSLHHTSLGSLFLVTPVRLHPLWYSTWIPVLFITSAMGAGMMVIVLVKILYAHFFDRQSVFAAQPVPRKALVCVTPECSGAPSEGRDLPMLRTLASIAAGVLALNLIIRIVDLWRTGAWQQLVAGSWETWLYALEIVLATILPIAIIAVPRARRSPAGLASAATLAASGMVLNRLNVGIFGYFRDAQSVYLPSLTEWALSLGVIAAAALTFLYVAENFAVFDEGWKQRRLAGRDFLSRFDSFSRVWTRALGNQVQRVSLLVVLAAPLAWLFLYPPFAAEGHSLNRPVTAPVAADTLRTVLSIDGDRTGMAVSFPHKSHQDRLGGEGSCGRCHHLSLPQDNATPCSRCHRDMEGPTAIFNHTAHFASVASHEKLSGLHPANHSCDCCHASGQVKGAGSAKACLDCHRDDMKPIREPTGALSLEYADGYRIAMHDTCIPCHRAEAETRGRPELGECRHCHPAQEV